jgi:hypothetical protein
MAGIDRRRLVRGMLGCVAFVTAAGVIGVTPSITKAVPLSEGKAGPIKADDALENDDVLEADDRPDANELLDADDLLPESAQPAQYWRRRRRRWWRRRRRWICWRRRGRRVCRRRW